jgi:hypothetical protein
MTTAVQHLELLRNAAQNGILDYDAPNVEKALQEFKRIHTEAGLPIDAFGLRPPEWQQLQEKVSRLLNDLAAEVRARPGH